MAAVNLGGYDPNTGWPPDDSTGVNWDPDTDIPGQFGRGGFRTAPRLTGPASGPPPGVSLSGPGGAAAPNGPNVVPPTNTPLRPGASPAIRPGGFGPATDATVPGGGGLFSRLAGFLPSIFNPVTAGAAAPAAIAAAGYKWGQPASQKMSVDPRIDASADPFNVQQPLGPPQPGPTSVGNPDPRDEAAGDGLVHQPLGPSTTPYRPEDSPSYTDPRTFPGWPTPPAPAPSTQRGMPWPDTGVAPPTHIPIGGGPGNVMQSPTRRTPRAAGPAAVRQQPNLGTYSGPFSQSYRPNADVAGGARGRQSVPQMTTLDLSKLFSRQQ